MRRATTLALQAFTRDGRGSAGLEMAIGAVALVTVAALCIDLYMRVEADTTSARIAVTMADYVSRGPDTDQGTLDGKALKDLGEFLVEQELGVPADVVFVISLLRHEGTPPEVKVRWSDNELRYGDAAVTATLAGDCPQLVTAGTPASPDLPAAFNMDAGEAVVVVEVCARLTVAGSLTGRFIAGDIYRLHVLPLREPETPMAAPVHAHLGAGMARSAGA